MKNERTLIIGMNAPDVPLEVFPTNETLATSRDLAHIRPLAPLREAVRSARPSPPRASSATNGSPIA